MLNFDLAVKIRRDNLDPSVSYTLLKNISQNASNPGRYRPVESTIHALVTWWGSKEVRLLSIFRKFCFFLQTLKSRNT